MTLPTKIFISPLRLFLLVYFAGMFVLTMIPIVYYQFRAPHEGVSGIDGYFVCGLFGHTIACDFSHLYNNLVVNLTLIFAGTFYYHGGLAFGVTVTAGFVGYVSACIQHRERKS